MHVIAWTRVSQLHVPDASGRACKEIVTSFTLLTETPVHNVKTNQTVLPALLLQPRVVDALFRKFSIE